MSNKATGITFIGITAFIFVILCFTTAIWVTGVRVSLQVFNELFPGICVVPLIVSVFILGSGIFYLTMAEKADA